MGESVLDVNVTGGKINGYSGINFKEPPEGQPEDSELVNKLKEIIPQLSVNPSGGRRRKRRTKVKSKKRANRQRRTRYQH